MKQIKFWQDTVIGPEKDERKWFASDGVSTYFGNTKDEAASHFGVPVGFSATQKAASTMGRKGGQAKSPAKTATARENGRRGGRPVERRPYWILSGEGDVGGWRRYVTTPRGASMIATRERCDGDRWAQIWEEVPETEATRSHIRRVGYSDTRDIPTIE